MYTWSLGGSDRKEGGGGWEEGREVIKERGGLKVGNWMREVGGRGKRVTMGYVKGILGDGTDGGGGGDSSIGFF